MKKSEINISVELDENNVPEKIRWTAQDGGVKDEPSGAMILSMWDPKQQNAMRMDLWTKDMTVDEMKVFFHQTLLTMTDTFERATGDQRITGDMRDFCMYFAERMEILPEK